MTTETEKVAAVGLLALAIAVSAAGAAIGGGLGLLMIAAVPVGLFYLANLDAERSRLEAERQLLEALEREEARQQAIRDKFNSESA